MSIVALCLVRVAVVLPQQLQTLDVALRRGLVHQGGPRVGPCLVWVEVVIQQQLHDIDVAIRSGHKHRGGSSVSRCLVYASILCSKSNLAHSTRPSPASKHSGSRAGLSPPGIDGSAPSSFSSWRTSPDPLALL